MSATDGCSSPPTDSYNRNRRVGRVETEKNAKLLSKRENNQGTFHVNVRSLYSMHTIRGSSAFNHGAVPNVMQLPTFYGCRFPFLFAFHLRSCLTIHCLCACELEQFSSAMGSNYETTYKYHGESRNIKNYLKGGGLKIAC